MLSFHGKHEIVWLTPNFLTGSVVQLIQSCVLFMIPQGASRTAEDGERERKAGDERDERIGGAPPRVSASRGLPPGPIPAAANRVRNGPEQAISNPASRVQQSGERSADLPKSETPAVCLHRATLHAAVGSHSSSSFQGTRRLVRFLAPRGRGR